LMSTSSRRGSDTGNVPSRITSGEVPRRPVVAVSAVFLAPNCYYPGRPYWPMLSLRRDDRVKPGAIREVHRRPHAARRGGKAHLA
jgi:hypothetical protein